MKLDRSVTLVLGGARSGKSLFSENLVINSGLDPVYLATARAHDDEMRDRIETHRARREDFNRKLNGRTWVCVEEPLALADALRNCAFQGRVVLVDCLTLWVTNLMLAEADVEREIIHLISTLDELAAPVVFVSNEVGQGITPQNAMARKFIDLAGMVHQKLAKKAGSVVFITAGLPLVLKSGD